jgi:uncharacterized protein
MKNDDFASLLKMAEEGDADAQIEIASRYMMGIGVDKDFKKSFYWTEKSANQGNAKALNTLGIFYTGFSEIVDTDLEKAHKLFLKSADLGFTGAYINIAEGYKAGAGVEKSFDKAVYWYEKAIKEGDEPAKSILEDLKANPDKF